VLPYQNQKWDTVQTISKAWITVEPKSVEALYYAGVAAENLGDLNQANQHYQQVLTLHPQHSATLMALGFMANRAGKMDEVEKTRLQLKTIDVALEEEFTEALKPR
jgi:Flp pilus assembly protein TadD